MLIARREAMVAAMGGGLAFARAFLLWSTPWLAPVGVGALFLAAEQPRIHTGAAVALAFGLAFLGPTLWWLSESVAPAAWAALVVVQSGWLAVLGGGVVLARRLPGWPLWVAALPVSRHPVGAETGCQQLGHSSPAITREFSISKPAIAADVAHLLDELGRSDPSDDAIRGE